MGTTLADFHCSGKHPVLILRLHIVVMADTIAGDDIFRVFALIPSRPVALVVLINFSCLMTKSGCTAGILKDISGLTLLST